DRKMMAVAIARWIDQRACVMLGTAAVPVNHMEHSVRRPVQRSVTRHRDSSIAQDLRELVGRMPVHAAGVARQPPAIALVVQNTGMTAECDDRPVALAMPRQVFLSYKAAG